LEINSTENRCCDKVKLFIEENQIKKKVIERKEEEREREKEEKRRKKKVITRKEVFSTILECPIFFNTSFEYLIN